MKKLLLLFLTFPLSIGALSEKDISIECDNLKIGSNANCVFKLNNIEKNTINSIAFNYDESLLNFKTFYNLKKEEKYQIDLNSNDENIIAFNFDFLMEYNNIDIILNNLNISFDEENLNINNLSKSLQIENIAYVDNILINNQPIIDFDKNIYNYKVNLYEKNDYVEVKIITSDNNVLNGQANKIYKFVNGSNINFEVQNGFDTENYKINFIYNKQGLKTNEIKIKEIPFNFTPTKRYYYLEVLKDISKITIDNGWESKKYELVTGKNRIIYDNNGIDYVFVINRLKGNKSTNLTTTLKSLKIGDTHLNLQADSYNYTYSTDEIELVEVETEENQDYDISYNDDKIVINIYDANASKTTYNINLISKNTNSEAKKYDKTKSIIIFIAFSVTFILLTVIAIKKYRPFKKGHNKI